MITAYIDLNIFNGLEKLDNLADGDKGYYETLLSLLIKGKVVTAYSNAHLNDLLRGYQVDDMFNCLGELI